MAAETRSPPRFFLLLFGLSVPFWLAGGTTAWQPLPGVPIGALMFVCPALAAALLVCRESGFNETKKLLKRSFDCQRIHAKVWILPVLLLMPGVMLLSYAVMRLLGRALPTPEMDLRVLPLLFGAFLISAIGEQLGWSGYALEPLQRRCHALSASLILGVVWAAWHIIPLQQAGRAGDWIAWWCLATIALRVLQTWLYNNTGRSVFAAAVFQAFANASWQLFPNRGSHTGHGAHSRRPGCAGRWRLGGRAP
jgi:CAAX protease family protein